jgi:class 3 adenylate cyclase/predicted ATPase
MMFVDLVDSTVLSERLDPEDYRDIIRTYRDRCSEIVTSYEANIFGYSGDGILICFGYPVAHEDDAERSIRAALEIVKVMQERTPLGQSVQVHIGIATGIVIVGDLVGTETKELRSAIGETPNLAARLQALAGPNSVVISTSTRRLAANLFDFEDLGKHSLKGFSEAQRAWRVLRVGQVESRYKALLTTDVSPLVGREEEVERLLAAWDLAKRERGQVVLIRGEAGIGKSRLLQELKMMIAGGAHTLLACQGWALHQNGAYFPIIELIQHVLGIDEQDAADARLQKLENSFQQAGFTASEWVPILAPLLRLKVPDRFQPLGLSAEGQKGKTLTALVNLVKTRARAQPVLFLVEDAHWIDPSTLEFIRLLISEITESRILLVLSARPEFQAAWPKDPVRIEIRPLSEHQVRSLATSLADGKQLPDEVLAQVSKRADGVPLFVEELTRLLLDSGALIDAGDHFDVKETWRRVSAIPNRLQDLLLARLTNLTWEKTVAHLGAVLGRRFEYRLILAIWEEDESALNQALERLVSVGLLLREGRTTSQLYTFRHALIQEAAYNSLLKSERSQIHNSVANTLIQKFPEIVQNQPELIAQHFSSAGNASQAIAFWLRAGRRCSERSENVEAVVHIRKALDSLSSLPEGRQRLGAELELLVVMSSPLVRTLGYGSTEVETILIRARQLCRDLGETPQLRSVLVGLAIFHTARADLGIARELCEQVLETDKGSMDPTLDMMAHRALGSALFWEGDLVRARKSLEHAIAIYDHQAHHDLANQFFVDPGVVCLSTLGLTMWMLGYSEQALARSREAIQLGRTTSHAFSLGFALVYAAALRQLRDETRPAFDLVREATDLSTKHAFPQGLALGAAVRGWVMVQQGDHAGGLDEIQRGITLWRSSGTRLLLPYFLYLLADAHLANKAAEPGLAVVAEAMEMMDQTGERCWEPELHRLRGALRLVGSLHGDTGVPRHPQSPRAAAEVDFRHAMKRAHEMGSVALELRAATSLAHLVAQDVIRREEATDLLNQVCNQPTEVEVTRDLEKAKKLLSSILSRKPLEKSDF